jgi:8-oxo-dGTP pyrophosphatase MutT (NUDIX family)
VLVPLFRGADGELRILLVRRGSLGVHADQLGLPGGKPEPGDGSMLETALRETEEEVGLARSEIEVVEALEPLDSRRTGFRVHPFLARIRPPLSWRLAPGEIAGVVTPSLEELADPANRRELEVESRLSPERFVTEGILLEGDQLLWGLTLRLLEPVVPRLLAGEWEL